MITVGSLGTLHLGLQILQHLSAWHHVALSLFSLFALGTAINAGQNASAAWQAYSPADPVDNIFLRHFLLEQMRENGSFQEEHGDVIRANLEYALNPNVKFISEFETLTVSRPDTFDNAEYTWKLIGGDVPMSDLEAGITEGSASKFDLRARKIVNLKSTMDEKTNTSLFSDGTGTSSKEFGGLQLIVSTTPTTGTVGLISRVTYSFWRNQQKTGTKTSTAFDNLLSSMEQSYNDCSNGIGEQNPTFAITDQPSFQGYFSLTPAIERIVRDSTSNKLVRSFKGDQAFFKDIPVGYDPSCPAGNMYMLNNRNLRFVYMQWQKGEAAVRPADGFWDVEKVLTIGNLITDNSRRLGVVSAIT